MQPASGVPISPITGVPGWETDNEEHLLLALAQNVPDGGIIVELGCEYGRSAAVFCAGAKPTVKIFSFDLFPTDHAVVGDLLEVHKANMTEAGFQGRTVIVKFDSSSAGHKWPYGEVDLLFVDADHSYEAVKRDIEAWTLHIKVGGFVAFHDCAQGKASDHPLHKEVSRAVNEFWNPYEWRELPQVDSLRVFERTM